MAARAPEASHVKRRRIYQAFLLGVLGIGASACLGVRTSIGTLPPKVDSLEGYASWRLSRDGATAKSRFSFLLILPDRQWIEIADPLNRTVSRLIVKGETAWLVFPGRRAYWQAERREVMTRLLGFDIAPEELAGLITGQKQGLSDWDLDVDGRGRVVGGRRGDLDFAVGKFFPDSRLPETVSLTSGTDRGQLKVIRLQFNQPSKDDAFRLSFLDDERYRAVSWPEIEKWLRDEN